MLNRLTEYFHNLQFQIQNMLPQRAHFGGRSEWCCLSLTVNQILFIKARVTAEQFELLVCTSEFYDDESKIKTILTEMVKKHALKGVDCCWILQPEDYQFLLTDRLPVKPAEFQAAVRWKIKDLLTIPMDDLVIESFLIPTDQFSQAKEKMMVVAARLSYLQKIRNYLEISGLSLKKITIPELALKNIAAHYEQDSESTVLIYAHKNNIQLIFTMQKQFYFSRYLGHGLGVMESHEEIKTQAERLVNELNRSFDYYQSHWHNKPPVRALIAATTPISPEFIQMVMTESALQVHQVTFADFLKYDLSISEEQQAIYLPLIGGLMIDQEGSVS